MALNTYDDLKGEIAAIVARTDIAANDARIDTAIDLFEADCNLRLRHRRMQKTITAAAVGNGYALPSDFIEVFTFANTATPYQLTYVPQSAFVEQRLNSGQPDNYTIGVDANGLDTINVNAGGTFALTYYAKIPALSSTNQTNWLLTLYPDAYLSGATYFLFRLLRNSLAGDYKGLMDDAIEKLITNSETTTGSGAMRQRINGVAV